MILRVELFGDVSLSALSGEQRRILGREKARRYRLKNPEKVRAINRAWAQRNSVKVNARNSERVKRLYRGDAAFRRNWKITGHIRKYGLARDVVEAFDLVKTCEICELLFPASLLADKKINCHMPVIDHDHVSGGVRGVLCASCNSKLAWFEKNRDGVLGYLS